MKERFQLRHYEPGVDVPTTIVHKRQRFHFHSARMSRLMHGAVMVKFILRS